MAIDCNVRRQNMEQTDKQHGLNGYTKIPNDILETMARIRVSGEEGQCLWLILRKTYGWHKDEDWISNSQFAKTTGIKKQSINRAILKLIKKNIVSQKAYKGRSVYGLGKDTEKWVASAKKLTSVVSQNADTSKPKSLEVVSQNAAHKRNYTKETITKENPSDFEKALGVDIEGVIKTVD